MEQLEGGLHAVVMIELDECKAAAFCRGLFLCRDAHFCRRVLLKVFLERLFVG